MFVDPQLVTVYLPIIITLVVMEGLLSIDNAMIIAAMVDHLPEKQKRMALLAGMAGAYFFRGLMIVFAYVLITFEWIKILGALYLIYLMIEHFGSGYAESQDKGRVKQKHGFWRTVLLVELTDLAFSIDNVIAAVALSSNLWVVVTGVFIGIATMRLLANYFIELMQTRPILHSVAYILVGFVGTQLIIQEMTDHHLPAIWKFALISAIVGFCIYYEKNAILQIIFRPVFKRAILVMYLLNRVISYPVFVLETRVVSRQVPESDWIDRRHFYYREEEA